MLAVSLRVVVRVAAVALLAFSLLRVKAFVQRRVQVKSLGPVLRDHVDHVGESAPAGSVIFAQVSDLHVSRFRDEARAPDLRVWCDFLADHVRPVAVLATGDLVDAKTLDQTGSEQYDDEWKLYVEAREHCVKVLGRNNGDFRWLDTRGNHDVFDVRDNSPKHNPFAKYIPGRPSSSSLSNFTVDDKHYHVLLIDATPIPGQRRPFNFFGYLSPEEMEHIQGLLEDIPGEDRTKRTILAGHYPTSSYVDPDAIRALLGRSIYMSGHFHTGLSGKKAMYARHSTGLLELELGDWKTNRRFRLMAFDERSTMAVSDHVFGDIERAVIMVTHPRDVRTVVDAEDYEEGMNDEVRILVFSANHVDKMELYFDGQVGEVIDAERVKTKSGIVLFKAPLPVQDVLTGLHELQVMAYLSDGSTVTRAHSFSLDGSQIEFASPSTFILTNNWLELSEVVFYALGFITMATLVILRSLHAFKVSSQNPKIRLTEVEPWILGQLKLAFRKWWLLSVVNPIFYATIIFLLWLMFLPWSISPVLSDGYAIIFAWGIFFLDPVYLSHPDLTYAYGIMSFVFFCLFQLLPVARANEKTFMRHKRKLSDQDDSSTSLTSEESRSVIEDARSVTAETRSLEAVTIGNRCRTLMCSHLLFSTGIVLQIFHFVSIVKVYGILSSMGPWGLGRILFSLWYYKIALSVNDSCFKSLVKVW